MIIDEMDPGKQYMPLVQQKTREQGIPAGGASFSDTLSDFINDTNNLQVESADQTEKLIKGEPVDIHDVMITAQKAKTSFQLLMELRNKGLDLYREVLRLQV